MELAYVIQAYVMRRGGTLSLSVQSLHREINDYNMLRDTTSYCMVERSEKLDPEGWTNKNEQVWQDWISLTYDMQSWTKEVANFFDSSYRVIELFDFIGDWVQRDIKIVKEFDKEPIEEEEEVLYNGLDPYMVEHGMIKGIKHSTVWEPRDSQQ